MATTEAIPQAPAKPATEGQTAKKETQGDDHAGQFNLLRQYLKDASVEFPSSPQIFRTQTENRLGMELNSFSEKIEDQVYEVVLQIELSIISPEEKTLLMIECKYAGIFEIVNVADVELDVLLNVHALEILYPYLRETVSSLSMRTSLPPILLPPTNFVHFYQQKLQQQKTASLQA